MLLVIELLTYLPPPSLLLTPWSCEALPVISGMSLPVQERTGLNVALSCTSQVSHREALFHNSQTPPQMCVAMTKFAAFFNLEPIFLPEWRLYVLRYVWYRASNGTSLETGYLCLRMIYVTLTNTTVEPQFLTHTLFC